MGKHPLQGKAGADHPTGQINRSVGRHAHPMHAGIDLQVDRGPWGGGRRERLHPVSRVHRGTYPAEARHLGHLGRSGLGEQQDRGLDPLASEFGRLLHQGDGQPGSTGPERRSGHRNGAVAVPVGLDHRAQLGVTDQVGETDNVGRDGLQVDDSPGGAH